MFRNPFLFFLFCIHGPVFAQQSKIDSLLTLLKKDGEDSNKVIRLNKLCWEYQNMNSYDTSLRYGNAALQLAKKLNFSRGIAAAYSSIGLVYYDQGNYSKTLENYFASLKIREEMGDKKGIAASYNNIGLVYFDQGNYASALENHFSSLKIREEIGDKNGIATSYNNIGLVYYDQNDYVKALENYFACLEIKKEVGDKPGISNSYNNIGRVYLAQGISAPSSLSGNSVGQATRGELLDKALESHFTALKIKEEIGDKQGIAISYYNMGAIYYLQATTSLAPLSRNSVGHATKAVLLDRALENYFVSLKIFKEISDKQNISAIYIDIANVYKEKLNYVEAIVWLENGMRLAKDIGANLLLMNAYKGLSDVNEKMSDYRNAYAYHQLYFHVKDSIFNDENSKQIAELQTKYETEKKNKEIQFQALQLSEQQRQLTQNKILQVFLLVGIILIIIIAFLLYNRTKIKQRELFKTNLLDQQKQHTKAIIETQEQERTRIARDLHDGIGQTLAGIIANYEQLNSEIHSFSEEKQKKFLHTAKSLDETYKELRAISHQMMPRALKVAGLSAAISDLLDKTLANTSINYSFEKQSAENIPESTAIGIYRIFQELLGNILKHSHAEKIAVQLFNNQNQLILIVEDDGVGIASNKPDDKNTGIGLMNITARAQAMQGTFIIEPGALKGTVATAIIPFQQITDNK